MALLTCELVASNTFISIDMMAVILGLVYAKSPPTLKRVG